MAHSPAEIIANYLVNTGKAVWRAEQVTKDLWQIFVVTVPDNPFELLTIYDTQGNSKGRLQETKKTLKNPGIQVMSRSVSHRLGYDMLSKISDALDNIQFTTVIVPQVQDGDILIPGASYLVTSFVQTSPILSAGQDEKRRFLNTLNGTLTIP